MERDWLSSNEAPRGLLHVLSQTTERLVRLQFCYEVSPTLQEFVDNKISVPRNLEDLDESYFSRLQGCLDAVQGVPHVVEPRNLSRTIEEELADLAEVLRDYEPLMVLAWLVQYQDVTPAPEVRYLSKETPVPEEVEKAVAQRKHEYTRLFTRDCIKFARGKFDKDHPFAQILLNEGENLEELKTQLNSELNEDLVDLEQFGQALFGQEYNLWPILELRSQNYVCTYYGGAGPDNRMDVWAYLNNQAAHLPSLHQFIVLRQQEMYLDELARIESIRKEQNF